jgi:hypothetical protein
VIAADEEAVAQIDGPLGRIERGRRLIGQGVGDAIVGVGWAPPTDAWWAVPTLH